MQRSYTKDVLNKLQNFQYTAVRLVTRELISNQHTLQLLKVYRPKLALRSNYQVISLVVPKSWTVRYEDCSFMIIAKNCGMFSQIMLVTVKHRILLKRLWRHNIFFHSELCELISFWWRCSACVRSLTRNKTSFIQPINIFFFFRIIIINLTIIFFNW